MNEGLEEVACTSILLSSTPGLWCWQRRIGALLAVLHTLHLMGRSPAICRVLLLMEGSTAAAAATDSCLFAEAALAARHAAAVVRYGQAGLSASWQRLALMERIGRCNSAAVLVCCVPCLPPARRNILGTRIASPGGRRKTVNCQSTEPQASFAAVQLQGAASVSMPLVAVGKAGALELYMTRMRLACLYCICALDSIRGHAPPNCPGAQGVMERQEGLAQHSLSQVGAIL